MTHAGGMDGTLVTSTGFAGFQPEAVSFLDGLRDNNNKVWFQAHKAD